MEFTFFFCTQKALAVSLTLRGDRAQHSASNGTKKSTSTTTTATRSCRTGKRAFHFYSPGVDQRSHAEARHVRALSYDPPPLLLLLR